MVNKESIIRVSKAIWEDFTAKRVMNAASLLTYSTLLAVVPVVAVIFAVARGFGYNKYIESWFRSALDSQPQVAEVIVGFVNSYLVNTKSGVVFGIGLVFMLYTIIMLTMNIEIAFNDIWGVKSQRSLTRTFTDYLAMFFILPIMIIVMSGVTLWIASLSSLVNEMFVIGTLMQFGMDILPLLLLSCIIAVLYIFMPNTHVRWRCAVLPAFIAAVAMELLQYFYVHSQLWVSSYNAIYGSFAALPLFMLWLQFTWTIILIGAELAYTNQNLEDFRTRNTLGELSQRYRMMLSMMVMAKICRRFKEGLRPYTLPEIKKDVKIPMRILVELVYDLQQAGMIQQIGSDKDDTDVAFAPAESVENLTVGVLISRLESLHPYTLDAVPDLSSLKWQHVLSTRRKYLHAQKSVKLYEL
ncbi:MAG: YihY/virulence factor BrkB family protein [Bacteroidales bacterium]|nr:YihY/virulence factor BrkB family protein [Bacteroidales bacterium]MCM1206613.1 YihY/virulence factor BrkB family protein [Bacillota bacterium]MCM1510646.1 YihY/virulence factor BrkB family protein [Clostridium sp.]